MAIASKVDRSMGCIDLASKGCATVGVVAGLVNLALALSLAVAGSPVVDHSTPSDRAVVQAGSAAVAVSSQPGPTPRTPGDGGTETPRANPDSTAGSRELGPPIDQAEPRPEPVQPQLGDRGEAQPAPPPPLDPGLRSAGGQAEPIDLGPAAADSPIEISPRPAPGDADEDVSADWGDEGGDDVEDDDDFDETLDGPDADRARRMIRGGIIVTATGLLLVVGSIALAGSDPCARLAGNSCQETGRNRAAATMGIPGAVIMVGGATLLGLGLRKRIRLQVGASLGRERSLAVVGGRF